MGAWFLGSSDSACKPAWARPVTLALALLLHAYSPAWAQPAEEALLPPGGAVVATAPPAEKDAPLAPPLTPVQALLADLVEDAPSYRIASGVEDVLLQLGQPCVRITEYQVFRTGAGFRDLKVKCAERALVVLSVDENGGAQARGGDGSIPEMAPGDGEIVTIMGMRAEDYLRQSRNEAQLQQSRNALSAEPEQAGPGWLASMSRTTLAILVGANIALLGLLALALSQFWARRRAAYSGWHGLTSDDKDRLVEESAEVLPNIFRHPSGILIARGQRGKRRLFKSLAAAYLYVNFGRRVGEIR